MQSNAYSCQILIKLEFSRQSFEKCSNIKFHENSSNGIRPVPSARTDRHDKANTHFSKFCDRDQILISHTARKGGRGEGIGEGGGDGIHAAAVAAKKGLEAVLLTNYWTVLNLYYTQRIGSDFAENT
jgi:hypothetical protein